MYQNQIATEQFKCFLLLSKLNLYLQTVNPKNESTLYLDRNESQIKDISDNSTSSNQLSALKLHQTLLDPSDQMWLNHSSEVNIHCFFLFQYFFHSSRWMMMLWVVLLTLLCVFVTIHILCFTYTQKFGTPVIKLTSVTYYYSWFKMCDLHNFKALFISYCCSFTCWLLCFWLVCAISAYIWFCMLAFLSSASFNKRIYEASWWQP